MKQAFTMVEIIFVIVIVGILAAVAVPKLAATRDDASAVAAVQSAVNAIHNLGASFVAKGDYSAYTLDQANSEAVCFTYTVSAGSEGTVTVHLKETCINSRVRSSVALLAVRNGLLGTNATDKTFHFEGKKVRF